MRWKIPLTNSLRNLIKNFQRNVHNILEEFMKEIGEHSPMKFLKQLFCKMLIFIWSEEIRGQFPERILVRVSETIYG